MWFVICSFSNHVLKTKNYNLQAKRMDSKQILMEFETIQSRLQLLVAKLKETENRVNNVEKENANLKTELKLQEQNFKNLQKNQGNEQKDFRKREFFAKLVQNTGGSTDDTSDLKKALDEYIKEIDICIAKLSN